MDWYCKYVKNKVTGQVERKLNKRGQALVNAYLEKYPKPAVVAKSQTVLAQYGSRVADFWFATKEREDEANSLAMQAICRSALRYDHRLSRPSTYFTISILRDLYREMINYQNPKRFAYQLFMQDENEYESDNPDFFQVQDHRRDDTGDVDFRDEFEAIAKRHRHEPFFDAVVQHHGWGRPWLQIFADAPHCVEHGRLKSGQCVSRIRQAECK